MDPWAVTLPRRRARVRHGSSLIVDANAGPPRPDGGRCRARPCGVTQIVTPSSPGRRRRAGASGVDCSVSRVDAVCFIFHHTQYNPSRRSRAPTSPGRLHASTSLRMRSRYAGGKRRRSTFAGTSGSGSLARDPVTGPGPALHLPARSLPSKSSLLRKAADTAVAAHDSSWLARRSSQWRSTLAVALHLDHQAAVIAPPPLLNLVHRAH